jgi:hypothetical protein
MPRKSRASRLLVALPRLLLGTPGGRKLTVAVVACGAVWLLVRREVGNAGIEPTRNVGGDDERKGSWSGMEKVIAPHAGTFGLQGALGTAATCTVRGKTESLSGGGWVFRGEAVVAETKCEGRIETNGRVTADLQLKAEWHGRAKGMGGEWEDIHGKATCEGELTGTLGAGGQWKGKCASEEREWETTIDWKLDD